MEPIGIVDLDEEIQAECDANSAKDLIQLGDLSCGLGPPEMDDWNEETVQGNQSSDLRDVTSVVVLSVVDDVEADRDVCGRDVESIRKTHDNDSD